MFLLLNGRLLTRDPAQPWVEDGAVAVQGDTIAAVGDRAALEARYPDAERVDAHEGLIMPGLINAHTHIYSGLARGLSIPGNDPKTFLEVLEGTWWNIDRHLTLDLTRASAQVTALECIRNGVTTLFDHHASYAQVRGSLFAIRDELADMGLRACLCYEVSDRDGPQKCEEAILENAEFARWAAGQSDGRFCALFGGHALFTLSDRTLERMAQANAGLTGFHLHVAEGMDDVYDSLRRYARRPVERLLDAGLLGPKTMLGHCIHLSPSEWDILARTGTMVVNNPQSNMNNAVGCAPVLEMMRRGILVGLGTDAYTHDMLESLKAVPLIQRHHAALPNVGFAEAFQMPFINNAAIAARCFAKPLGVLRPGAAADIAVMDYRPFTPLGPDNADGHILFGLSGRCCRTVVANGRLVYRDRAFVDIDEQAVSARAQALSRKLWSRLARPHS